MKYTLLELVQDVASSMDSDEINSINDSVEAQQIAKVVRTSYFDIISRLDIPEHSTLFNLAPSGDNTKPVVMSVPIDVAKVQWIKYDWGTLDDPNYGYKDVCYLPIKKFLDRMDGFNLDNDNVGTFTQTIDGSSIVFKYMNDAPPTFYTSFDDVTIIFDSYDSSVDTTLTGAKSRAFGRKIIPWTVSDTFVPDLNEPQFELLLNESKSLAWAELRQVAHQKAESSARRQWVRSQRTKPAVDAMKDLDKLSYFGRR